MTGFNDHLRSIYDDRQSGSAAVLNRLIQAIGSGLEGDHGSGKMINQVKGHLDEMKDRLSHFAVVDHFLKKLTDLIESREVSGKQLSNFLNDYKAEWKDVNIRIARHAIENIGLDGKTILLHSNSSTVTELFRQMKHADISASVIQTESRPEYEGRRQAIAISRVGYPVKLIVDSAFSLFLKDIDIFITGADQIHQQYFVNKIGTWPMASMCHELEIPVYVLADSRKIQHGDSRSEDLQQPEKSPQDIWKTTNENITLVNFYFETVPNGLINGFITEKSCFAPSEL